MYRIIKNIFIVLIVSNYFVAYAQSNEIDFKKIIIEIEGEEVYDVNAIAQDQQGYLWMATNLGLIRYDGIIGKKYQTDSPSNDYNSIGILYVDSQGDVWIGGLSGLSIYNSDCDCINKFPAIDYSTFLTDINAITEDNDKNIWIGTQNGGLFRYDRESKNLTRFLHNPSDSINIIKDNINHLLVDQNNNLWIGIKSINSITRSGLIRYNIITGNIKQFLHDSSNPNSLLDNRISALYEDQLGQILIGTYKCGFHIYNSVNESFNRISFDTNNPNKLYAPFTEEYVNGNDPFVRIIQQDKKGGYWISTTGKGINYFNPETRTKSSYNFNLINPQLTWSFCEDKQGNIWIGGINGGGLFKGGLFERKYNLNTNFSNVEAAYESPLNPGVVWVKSRQGGLSKMNLKTDKITRYSHNKDNVKSIGHNWVRSVYQENKEILWVGIGNGGVAGVGTGNGGIDQLNIESGTFTHFKLTRNDDELKGFSYTVYSIVKDREGFLWLGTGTGGIFKSDKDKTEFNYFEIANADDILKDVIINLVIIDSNGDLWASDFKNQGTLYLFNRHEDKFKLYLKGFKATNVLIDKQGWYLISTWENGLLHLNPVNGKYIQYTKKNGLPSNVALDIVKGDGGDFWVSTRMGPAKFESEAGKISSVGLPKGRYNYGIFKTTDDKIYLGANNGLVSFYPSQVKGNPFPPQITISDMLISDKNYLKDKNKSGELNFSYNQNDITFKYVGLHFSNSNKNLYQYKLKPINDQWIKAGANRTARYFNLPPGSYNFQVKAANSDGVWSDKTESVQFTIKPSWWTTWWAYTIYIVTLVFLSDRFYRFQLSKRLAVTESVRLKEVNQLKNRLFTNITHEFRTPLTVIKGMTDSIKSKLENKQLENIDYSFEMIERNSDNLIHLVNDMLDLAKIESRNLDLHLKQSNVIPFLKYVTESFSSLAGQNKINLTIYSELDRLVMDFDEEKITSVISNLLSNAIKFTPEFGKIIIHINQTENDFLFIKIKDNGIGISNKELPNIFDRFYQVDASTKRISGGTGIGLSLTKELVSLMRGTIEVKSNLGKGSEFILMFPITRQAPVSKKAEYNKLSIKPISISIPMHSEQLLETDSNLPLVLIIEDNIDVAHYLKTCLEKKYVTIHAINGIKGIELAIEKIPDIIICDVMMPGKDGFEVCTFLKSDERTDHIPIIILTAKVTVEDRLTGLAHGADAYLAKPFNKEELFTRLDQLVSVRKKLINKIQNDGFNALLKKRFKNPKLKFLKKIVKLIRENIRDSNFGSEALAKELLISESQIYRKIKAITGKSTAVYIRSIRLQYAKELLLNSTKTVSEVAYDVGFNDPSWFSRIFKNEFGFTPSETSR